MPVPFSEARAVFGIESAQTRSCVTQINTAYVELNSVQTRNCPNRHAKNDNLQRLYSLLPFDAFLHVFE